MNFNGTIHEIKNIDKLFNSVFDEFKDLPQMQKTQIEAQLKKAYGEKAFKGNLETASAIFPDKKVSINDTWQNKIQVEAGMAIEINTTYTLVEYSTDYAIIKGNGVTKTLDKGAIPINGVPAKYDLSGTTISTIKINSNTGWILEANINQNIEGKVEIEANPNVQKVMSIPMKIKSTTEITNK